MCLHFAPFPSQDEVQGGGAEQEAFPSEEVRGEEFFKIALKQQSLAIGKGRGGEEFCRSHGAGPLPLKSPGLVGLLPLEHQDGKQQPFGRVAGLCSQGRVTQGLPTWTQILPRKSSPVTYEMRAQAS